MVKNHLFFLYNKPKHTWLPLDTYPITYTRIPDRETLHNRTWSMKPTHTSMLNIPFNYMMTWCGTSYGTIKDYL
jgi:hypothetical protein